MEVIALSKKVPVVISLGKKAIEQLTTNKKITTCETFTQAPKAIIKVIADFIKNHVGYETGPIFCITKVNNKSVCLNTASTSTTINDIIDILMSGANNIVIEFSVDIDFVVSIGFDEFLELCDQYKIMGEEDGVFILETLEESLKIGVDIDNDDTIISFIPSLELEDCSRYFRITSDLEISTKAIFKHAEEIKLSTLNKFY